MMGPDDYPRAADPEQVGNYPASVFAGGDYVWDEVLEYRVRCSPERGAQAEGGKSDYFYPFSTYSEALSFSEKTIGADAPLALVLQREYMGGVHVHG